MKVRLQGVVFGMQQDIYDFSSAKPPQGGFLFYMLATAFSVCEALWSNCCIILKTLSINC